MEFVSYAVIALITFAIGGFWYSPAGFLNRWAKESKIDLTVKPENPKHPAIVFGLAYVASVLAVFALSRVLGAQTGVVAGLQTGALVGGLIVATSFAVNYAFGSKTFVLWLIDAGYHFIQFTAFGAALGAWPRS